MSKGGIINQGSEVSALPISRRLDNRVLAIMAHTTRYAFKGRARLAQDAGVSKSTVCRVINGQCVPSLRVMHDITAALSRALGRGLDPWDVFSVNGTYREPSVCALCGCRGCVLEDARDEDGVPKSDYKPASSGDWEGG